MSDDRRFVVREDLLVEQVDEEVMILDMERNVYFGLDPMARAVWVMLVGESSVEEIISTLEARYGDRERITRDVVSFIEQVLAHQLMRERAA
jgi:hypothetical protein